MGEDESLGQFSISEKFTKAHLLGDGFDGEVNLSEGKTASGASLKFKMSTVPGGGIGFAEFKTMFAAREPCFLGPLTEELTGMTYTIAKCPIDGDKKMDYREFCQLFPQVS